MGRGVYTYAKVACNWLVGKPRVLWKCPASARRKGSLSHTPPQGATTLRFLFKTVPINLIRFIS